MIASLVRRLWSLGEKRTSPASGPRATLEAEALIEPALVLLRQARTDDAIAALEGVLKNHHDVAEAHLLLGSILHKRQQLDDAADSYVLARCFKPEWWLTYFHIGLLALDRDRPGEAAAALTKALELGGAGDARAHNAMGRAYLEQQQIERALQQFEQAIVLDPAFAEGYSNLGFVLFHHMEEFETGAKHIEKALLLDVHNITARFNWSMVLQHRGKIDEALALCSELLIANPDFHEARANRALLLLSKGDFGAGWRDYEARRELPAYRAYEQLPLPHWDGSNLTGKKIVVCAEQGLGDEIMFASCMPELLTAARVCILECQPKLEHLLRRSFPALNVVRKGEWQDAEMLRDGPPDYKVAAGSLPRFMRNKLEDFPARESYLRADSGHIVHWRRQLDKLPGQLKVGISWRGGAATTRRSLRSIPLRSWIPLLRLPSVDFVNLQYSDCTEELAELRAESNIELHYWDSALDDYDQTAALVSALDLVISVQTAVVHLAGALGKAVWALIPAVPEWRYGVAGPSMPWYPTARLFRQSAQGAWDPLMSSVRDELEALLPRGARMDQNPTRQ
jgi:tetratricopeptide (TPR) repeat protein